MKFIHNRILSPSSGGPTFNEWLQKLANQIQLERAASEAKPGLGLPDGEKDPRGEGRGQVINNDNEEGANSYQKGESVDGKKEQGGNARPDKGGKTDQQDAKQTDKEASACDCKKCKTKPCKCASVKAAECGKEMGESSDAGKVTEKHTEAAPGDDNNKDCKQMINNDPNYQKGESTDPAKATGKNKKGPGDPVVGKGKKASSKKFVRIASADRLNKLRLFASFSANRAYHIGHRPLDYVEAMVGISYANMTSEEKEWFKDFWLTMYDEEYVSEMVKDR